MLASVCLGFMMKELTWVLNNEPEDNVNFDHVFMDL